jgi:UDP-3-O-[3-hydroxymyristoyl] glucosamine N-acyltransferase
MSNLLIFGKASTGLEIFEVARRYYNFYFDSILFVIGNHEIKDETNQIFDSELESFCKENECKYIISFSNNAIRLKTEELMNNLGLPPFSIIHPSAIISDTAKVDLGNYIAANVVISSYAKLIGSNIVNYNSTIGHHSVINSHCIINPGARISGNVFLGKSCLVGSNSFLFQGISIGQNCIIDALTHIDKDLPEKMIASSKNTRIFKRVII